MNSPQSIWLIKNAAKLDIYMSRSETLVPQLNIVENNFDLGKKCFSVWKINSARIKEKLKWDFFLKNNAKWYTSCYYSIWFSFILTRFMFQTRIFCLRLKFSSFSRRGNIKIFWMCLTLNWNGFLPKTLCPHKQTFFVCKYFHIKY